MIFSTTLALVLSLGLVFSVLALVDLGTLYGQQNQTSNQTGGGGAMGNQTNQTGGGGAAQQGQQNETGIGTAQEIESGTPPAGGVGQDQEGEELGIIGGLEKEQTSTETATNMSSNQTGTSSGGSGGGGGTSNETAAAATNQTTGGGEGQQQQGNQTGQGPLEQIGEAIGDMFQGGGEGGNPSN